MTDLRSQLLSSTSRSPFEEKFENIKKLLQTVSSQNDKFEVLVDADKTQATLREAKFFYLNIRESLTELKDNLLAIEKISRGMEQKNKTKKLRDMFLKESERHAHIHKQILSSCSEEQKEMFKSPTENGKHAGKANGVPMYYEKFEEDGSVRAKGYINPAQKLTQETVVIQMEHLDWQNQLIQENQRDLDHIEERSQTMNKIVLDLAQEVDRQDEELNVITTHVVKTHDNVVVVNKELNQAQAYSKNGTRKYLWLLLCVIIFTAIVVGMVFMFK